MKKLNDYIFENRKDIPSPKTEYSWDGEMYIGTKALFYDVPVGNNIYKVFAYLSFPKVPKPKNGYPALLLIHGGNGCAFYEMANEWSEKGYIVIAPDFNGKYANDLNIRNLNNPIGGPKGYGSFNDMYDSNPWAYFSVLSAMRAIDVLTDLPCVDKNIIFACGLSWGGFINLLLASQEQRIRAFSVIYASAFISNSNWGMLDNHCGKFNQQELLDYNQHIDPQSYLNNIKTPILFTAGTDDIAFTMENRRKTSLMISSDKYWGYRFSYPHGNFYGFEQPESHLFFKQFINDRKWRCPNISIKDNIIKVDKHFIDSETFLVETNMLPTNNDRLIWSERKFFNSVELLSDTKSFFIEEKIKNKYIISTDIYNNF